MPRRQRFIIVFVRVTIAAMKRHDQNNLVRKGFIWLTLPQHCSSVKEFRAETEAEQPPGGRSYAEAMMGPAYWHDLHGLLNLFLIASKATSPVVLPPTMGWVLYHQSQRICPINLPAG